MLANDTTLKNWKHITPSRIRLNNWLEKIIIIIVWCYNGLVAKFEEHYHCKLLKYEVMCGPSG
jgi:hypothetical protein